ncbi:molybdenum cofactor guanylyltransferase [Haladaptatus pallidirubidus]|uniref:Molybdenum cofactor guanylyltransferase n=1 Tax=Haladaptatus pallidirubidus TaxID=1008152 RepID=A0AAV3UR25_9EURY|nr:molybdenum cofactor guanylyltransferase [Haladaptatus pallidirubidus]
MRSGIIVAGGRSERFGEQDKALAEFDGEPLVCQVAESVVEVVDELVVNCRTEQVGAIRRAFDDVATDLCFAIDEVPDRGPVAGMAKGLEVANAPVAVVTACDMPTLDPNFLELLFDDARNHAGAVPIFDGYRQPLCAVYHVKSAIETCYAALSTKKDGFHDVLDRLDPVVILEEEVRERTDATTFRNVNTQIDLKSSTS